MIHNIEIVVWEDHHDPDDKAVWDKATPPAELGPAYIVSAGTVVSESETMIELVRDFSVSDGLGGAFVHILKKCVVSRQPMCVDVPP